MRTLLLVLPLLASAQTRFDINPVQGAKISMEIFKTGLLSGKKHDIEFTRYSGTLLFDPAKPELSKVDLTIETPSIIVLDQWLKSDDQKKVKAQAVGKEGLEIDKHPTMRFVSGGITAAGADGKYTMRGELTIRGIAKPAIVNVTMKTAPDGTLTFTGTSVVKMTDYGIKPPKAALGAVGTKDEMPIAFTIITPKK